MNDAALAALRNESAGLRVKAGVSGMAIAAARDLAVVVPAALTEAVSGQLKSGELLARFRAALAAAPEGLRRLGGGAATQDEITAAALSALMADMVKLSRETIEGYAEKVEADRKHAEGKAAGIDHALAALEFETPPTA